MYLKFSLLVIVRSRQNLFITQHFYRSILSLLVAMAVSMDADVAETT